MVGVGVIVGVLVGRGVGAFGSGVGVGDGVVLGQSSCAVRTVPAAFAIEPVEILPAREDFLRPLERMTPLSCFIVMPGQAA